MAVDAQMSIGFSPIAFSTAGVTATGGSPFVFFGKNKCLVMGNGITVLTVASNNVGEFGTSCIEGLQRTSLNSELVILKVFPNPTNGPTIVKCEGQFEPNTMAQLKILSLDGRLMMRQMILMKELQAGFTIQTGAFATGTYLIGVDFSNQQMISKLIKF